jgi:beta-glucosidase
MRIPLLLLASLALVRAQGNGAAQGVGAAPVNEGESTAPSPSPATSSAAPEPSAAANSTAAVPEPSGNTTVSDGTNSTTPDATSASTPSDPAAAPSDPPAPSDAADSPVQPSATSSAACTFCTVPAGYTAEEWDAPLHVEEQFSPRWREAHRKAKAYLDGWSVEEKVDVVTGAGWMKGRCVGNTKPIPARNWTGLCLQDSPLGVRFGDFVSAFPAGINAAAT